MGLSNRTKTTIEIRLNSHDKTGLKKIVSLIENELIDTGEYLEVERLDGDIFLGLGKIYMTKLLIKKTPKKKKAK